jgi:hypothetical protein
MPCLGLRDLRFEYAEFFLKSIDLGIAFGLLGCGCLPPSAMRNFVLGELLARPRNPRLDIGEFSAPCIQRTTHGLEFGVILVDGAESFSKRFDFRERDFNLCRD